MNKPNRHGFENKPVLRPRIEAEAIMNLMKIAGLRMRGTNSGNLAYRDEKYSYVMVHDPNAKLWYIQVHKVGRGEGKAVGYL